MTQNAPQKVTPEEAVSIAFARFQAGELDNAESLCKQILSVEPKNAEALHLQGLIAFRNGRYRQAIKSIEQAIKINKNNPHYHCNLALVLQKDGQPQKALMQYEKALSLKPDLVIAHTNMANVLEDQGRYDEAVARYKQAIAIDPGHATAYYNLGRAYFRSGRYDEAIVPYQQAIALKPGMAEAYTNLGAAFKEKGRLPEAVAMHERAIALDPAMAEAYNNLGIALQEQLRYEEAIAAYKKGLAVKPDHADAWYNLALTYQKHGKLAESIEASACAIKLDPENQGALCILVHQLQHACAWENLAGHERRLLEMVREGRHGISPFSVLNLPATPRDQLTCARAYSGKFTLPPELRFSHASRKRRGKLRVGYLSSDLYYHATAFLMAELFERHDRSAFEITAYSYGKDDGTEMRQRLMRGFDAFVDIRDMSHPEAAKKIYDDGIDILVDLKGHTGGSRLQIAAYKPAPIQVNYLGYPGTMGADFMDYIIADPFILPMDQQPFFSEQIVQMPDCYQPNDTKREVAQTPTRASCGLPEEGFVFCSFNSAYKITPDVFDIWMRLLKAVPESVLWLYKANPLADGNLKREAAARGVDPERLVLAPPMPLPEHLARHRLADLFLDNLPVNAHTGASDALWVGLPLLTCAGTTFAGRVAGSLLTTAGLPELVAHNLQDYEALALALARDPARLQSIREKLERTRLRTPLFDIEKYVANLESAYETMWKTWEAGEGPGAFAVKPTGTA